MLPQATVSNQIKEWYPGYEAVLTTRGAQALYLALQCILEESGTGEVILPASICPTVPMVVMLAGFKAVFCDIAPSTFNINGDNLSGLVTSRTRALIACHLFGTKAPIAVLSQFCKERGIFLIEDAAHSFGGTPQAAGERAAAPSDFVILSFGEKKIIGQKGGALLVANKGFVATAEKLRRLIVPLSPELYAAAGAAYQKTFAQMKTEKIGTRYKSEEILGKAQVGKFRYYLLHGPHLAPADWLAVANAIAQLKVAQAERFASFSRWRKILSERVPLPAFGADDMIWRVPVVLPDPTFRDRIVSAVREMGGVISDHYAPASRFFGHEAMPGSDHIGLGAVNLFVDRPTSAKVEEYLAKELTACW